MNLFLKWQNVLKCFTISLTADDSNLGKLGMNYYDYFIWTTFVPVVQKRIKYIYYFSVLISNLYVFFCSE